MLCKGSLISFVLLSSAAFACNDNNCVESRVVLPVNQSTCIVGDPVSSNLYMAVKWYRNSSEQKAIYLQIFRLAAQEIQAEVKEKKFKPKTWGVTMDIDETILDNSDYQAMLAAKCASFNPVTWKNFIETEASTAIPGAVEFTKEIHSLGGRINLVSGRTEDLRKATISNLNKYGFVYDQVILSTPNVNGMEKNHLFNAIAEGKLPSQIKDKQNIIAYLGDNIQDFPNSEQSVMIKQSTSSSAYAKFGRQYFVFPNPMYGTWPKNEYK